jgi:hypothetical protein
MSNKLNPVVSTLALLACVALVIVSIASHLNNKQDVELEKRFQQAVNEIDKQVNNPT